MTYLHFICTGHHVELGVSAWIGSTLCLVFDHGESTLCLVFENLSWAQGKSTPCLVLIVGSVLWTMSNGLSWVHFIALNKTVYQDCPMLLNKVVYRRLSNPFE